MQTDQRQKLECIFLKGFYNNAFSEDELNIFLSIANEFSTTAKKAFEILQELIKNNSYDENLFLSKVADLNNQEFFKDYAEASYVANLAPLLKDYEKCIKLDKQEELSNFILYSTQKKQVLELDSNLLKPYDYVAKKDDFKTFAEAEQTLKQDDPRTLHATGIEFLDTAFDGGLATGQLILISGDYEAGKTTLTTQIIENMSARNKVCFFCFEFTLSAYIRRRQAQPNKLFNKNNLITITDGYDIREIKENIINLNRTKGIKIFLIDSQMRVENNHSQQGSGEEKESEKFEILGKLSHEKELIIMLIIQTSKSDPDTPFKSKKGAHEASIIMHLENVESKDLDNRDFTQKRLKVKKNKQTGKHFKEDIFLNMKTGQFVKNPEHFYKNTDYNPADAVLGKTIIDLKELPIL